MKKHIPNAITCCNLISGCGATMHAFAGQYTVALAFIIIGAVFDFFDGMTARLLHVSSPIGKELDSLADCITFGFAPSAMIYDLLAHSEWPAALPDTVRCYIPFVAFLMAAFSALRLAKFNLDERQALGFIGLPTPANALFWASLIVGASVYLHPYPVAVVAQMLISCFLLVCELPMFALKFKTWGWRGNEIKYLFVASSLPILIFFGMLGIAVVILWYVVLSLIATKFLSPKP